MQNQLKISSMYYKTSLKADKEVLWGGGFSGTNASGTNQKGFRETDQHDKSSKIHETSSPQTNKCHIRTYVFLSTSGIGQSHFAPPTCRHQKSTGEDFELAHPSGGDNAPLEPQGTAPEKILSSPTPAVGRTRLRNLGARRQRRS